MTVNDLIDALKAIQQDGGGLLRVGYAQAGRVAEVGTVKRWASCFGPFLYQPGTPPVSMEYVYLDGNSLIG